MRGYCAPNRAAATQSAGKNQHIHGQDPGPDPTGNGDLDGHIEEGEHCTSQAAPLKTIAATNASNRGTRAVTAIMAAAMTVMPVKMISTGR